MDKLKKLVSDFLSVKFNDWKPHLTEIEQDVFWLFYCKNYSIIQICHEVNYSEAQVNRILKSARIKVEKILSKEKG